MKTNIKTYFQRMITSASMLLTLIALTVPSNNASAGGDPDENHKAVAEITSTSGSDVTGEVWFTQTDEGVMMVAELEGVFPSGGHAIHIHEKGDCSAKDGSSAGGHWNPTKSKHGNWGEKPYHRGDIGNLISDEKGRAHYDHQSNEWCVGCEDDKMDVVGKAVVIHIGEDDEKSQPSGAAGARIGCGVIQMKVK